MPVGTLQVDFIANIATYIADLGKVTAQTEATARRIERSLNGAFDSIKSHVVGLASALGVGFSIHGIEEMISSAIADKPDWRGLLRRVCGSDAAGYCDRCARG